MLNDRILNVSMAGTRKTKHWPRTQILWSEFVHRLKTPVRSKETREEYLALPKYQQDDLKDVGGFVGGTFEYDLRKAAYAEGRDLITLDFDNIPAGQTDDILKRISGLVSQPPCTAPESTRGMLPDYGWLSPSIRQRLRMNMNRQQGR